MSAQNPKLRHRVSRLVTATLHRGPLALTRQEMVAEEVPIALVYNCRPHAVMMATPADLDDFAVGFTLSEGIVDHASRIKIVDRLQTARGISMEMLIPQACFDALDDRQRNLTGRTGCGLCGAASLESAIRPVRRVTPSAPVPMHALREALNRLVTSQTLNADTGAVHAAACLLENHTVRIREDVGRHNAVDKALGASAGENLRITALIVTSRASYEIVHKAAQLDCGTVVAVSAPTALAIDLAKQAGITLIGFAREGRMTMYASTPSSWAEAIMKRELQLPSEQSLAP